METWAFFYSPPLISVFTVMQLPVPAVTIGLLLCSNIFMTFAWYGHLKHRGSALPIVILISWGIAFFEYVAELKTIQEVISLSVFCLFSVFYLNEPLRWNYIVGFGLIVLAAWVIFKQW